MTRAKHPAVRAWMALREAATEAAEPPLTSHPSTVATIHTCGSMLSSEQ